MHKGREKCDVDTRRMLFLLFLPSSPKNNVLLEQPTTLLKKTLLPRCTDSSCLVIGGGAGMKCWYVGRETRTHKTTYIYSGSSDGGLTFGGHPLAGFLLDWRCWDVAGLARALFGPWVHPVRRVPSTFFLGLGIGSVHVYHPGSSVLATEFRSC